MQQQQRKQLGAYFTPEATAATLVKWAVRGPRDRLLDPAAGDGRFVSLHKRSVGVETDPESAALARIRAPWALIHEGDFFAWAERTKERFECAAGNPPFIRYQRFAGEVRARALRLCSTLGVDFSSLASSWAPFLVAAASLLKPGGRLAFVVPAEIGHAPYAAPLIRFLLSRFGDLRVVAIREKIFPDISEDVWLLYADRYGEEAAGIRFVTASRFAYSGAPPSSGQLVTVSDLRRTNYRLRPFLLPANILDLYLDQAERRTTTRLGQLARVGIGYVTGANDFFHVRPSLAARLALPKQLLHPSVRNGRVLPDRAVTAETVANWIARDDPCLLLKLPRGGDLPESVQMYLDGTEGRSARESYKCRTREPWYSVPDVSVPHAFLTYMSGGFPSLVENRAGCVGTNSVHAVRLTAAIGIRDLQRAWKRPLTALSCELEGHPLGGGMLKIEPREAQRVAISLAVSSDRHTDRMLSEGVQLLRTWRHCNA